MSVASNSNSDHIISKDRYTLGPTPDDHSGTPPTSSLPWSAITDRPPLIDSFAALADAPGVLTNDGSGGLSWGTFSVDWADITGTPTDLAGYGITDAVDTSTFTGFVSTLSALAFSGSWADLTGTPTDLAGYGITDAVDTSTFTGFVSTLAAVAFSGLSTDVAFSSSTGLSSTDVSSALDELNLLIGGGGGTVADGDYGDITVSGTGTVWTIDNATVTPAKITNRSALSVFGRSANSSGVGADIAAGTDAHVLRRSGTTLGFGTIGDASISALAFSKLTALPATLAGHGITDAQPLDADLTAIAALTTAPFGRSLLTLASAALTASGHTMTAARLLGRTTAATGAVEELTAGTSLSLGSGSLNTIQDIRTSATPTFAGLIYGNLQTVGNQILEFTTNANSSIAINYSGYAGGTTQFRDFGVYDGKNNVIFGLVGATKAATFAAAVTAPQIYPGNFQFTGNQILEFTTNANSSIAINYSGYAGGTTQFRDFAVYDGKNNSVFSLTGSSKLATFGGNIIATRLGLGNQQPYNGTGAVFDLGDAVATAASGYAFGTWYRVTLTASANNDNLHGFNVGGTVARGAFTGLTYVGGQISGISTTGAGTIATHIGLRIDQPASGTVNYAMWSTGIHYKGNTTAPAINPTAGGFLWVESGALKYRGSSGTVTTIANA